MLIDINSDSPCSSLFSLYREIWKSLRRPVHTGWSSKSGTSPGQDTPLALDSVGLLPGLVFLLANEDVDEADDDEALPPDVADDSAWTLLLAGLAAADLPGPFEGSGREAFAFSKIGITLDFEAGWKW